MFSVLLDSLSRFEYLNKIKIAQNDPTSSKQVLYGRPFPDFPRLLLEIVGKTFACARTLSFLLGYLPLSFAITFSI